MKTFEINLDEHIVSVPSDAASVMCKFGRLIEKKSSEIITAGSFHILCANHGIHLCIMDVAYKIVAKNEENIVEENSESDEVHNEENENDDIFSA